MPNDRDPEIALGVEKIKTPRLVCQKVETPRSRGSLKKQDYKLKFCETLQANFSKDHSPPFTQDAQDPMVYMLSSQLLPMTTTRIKYH